MNELIRCLNATCPAILVLALLFLFTLCMPRRRGKP